MEKEYLNTRPEALTFMPLPDKENVADVWLRKNIEEEVTEEGGTMYVCDSVYFRTNKTEEDCEAHFDEYFNDPPEWHEPQPYVPPTLEERLEMQEDAITELAELVSELLS